MGRVFAETIVASVTAVTLGALWLADRVVKRTLAAESEPEVWIEPYVFPARGLPCPKCGVNDKADPAYGPHMPVACKEGSACLAFPRDHLHVSCGYCKAVWARAAKHK